MSFSLLFSYRHFRPALPDDIVSTFQTAVTCPLSKHPALLRLPGAPEEESTLQTSKILWHALKRTVFTPHLQWHPEKFCPKDILGKGERMILQHYIFQRGIRNDYKPADRILSDEPPRSSHPCWLQDAPLTWSARGCDGWYWSRRCWTCAYCRGIRELSCRGARPGAGPRA